MNFRHIANLHDSILPNSLVHELELLLDFLEDCSKKLKLLNADYFFPPPRTLHNLPVNTNHPSPRSFPSFVPLVLPVRSLLLMQALVHVLSTFLSTPITPRPLL